jgi:RNA polymerase sigma-70 factor, ECF subfamily
MNDKEFAGIVNSTKSVVLSAIKKNLAPQYYHSIDDVVQETYLRAYKSLIKKAFRGDSSMETWLYAIARNESLRIMKKLNREDIKLKKKGEILAESAEEASSIEKSDDNIKRMDLDRIINDLPEKYRSVMKLISMGFSEKQIAGELSLNKGTVKSRVFRAKSLMQRMAGGTKNVIQ